MPLLRVVFDTNTAISALLFRGMSSWLVDHWQARQCVPLVSHATAYEFLQVLAYPKFGLTPEQVQVVAGRYLPWAERIEAVVPARDLPQCRDPHDQKFLDLAVAGQAAVVVSGDDDLLALRAAVPFAIETPSNYRKRFA